MAWNPRVAVNISTTGRQVGVPGEGNDAATQLTRAGDAIYNDRRGEGADPMMRIAFLSNRDRREWIAAVRSLGGDQGYPFLAGFAGGRVGEDGTLLMLPSRD